MISLLESSTLICGGNSGSWNWKDFAHDEATMNGVEAWVFALQGDYKQGITLEAADFARYDLIVVNLNFGFLPHYLRVLREGTGRRATIVGLFEGDLGQLEKSWKEWSAVADLCSLIISINDFGTSFLQSLTTAPVRYIGIPYPVDGVHTLAVSLSDRSREIFLCSSPLSRPNDYLAARSAGLQMLAYEETFSRRLRELVRHRSFDKLRYVRRAHEHYNDSKLTILPRTHLPGYFERVSRSLLWMNLDPRYTWARFVLDAAALGVPIITTHNTGHALRLFPDLLVESPFDIGGAQRLVSRLLEDPALYQQVIDHAASRLDWYRPERTVERLFEALNDEKVRSHYGIWKRSP